MINYKLTVDEIIEILEASGLLEDPDGMDAEEVRDYLENPGESENAYAMLRDWAFKGLERGDERFRSIYEAIEI